MARLTIYACLAAAAAGAALAWSFQAARLGAELADERLQASQYREQIADERTAAGWRVLAVERTVNATYQGALNDAIQKQAGLQAAADRARRERDGLQRYTELAIRADGHAADAATCRAAWPVIHANQ